MSKIQNFFTGIVSDPRFLLHLTGNHAFETPNRCPAIIKKLKNGGLMTDANQIKPRLASKEELLLCHTSEYIDKVEREAAECSPHEVRQLSTGDVMISKDTFDAAKLAAGGVFAAIDQVMEGKYSQVFCIVRPPGHHATSNIGMGFCIFNNVALGAHFALKKWGLKKVLIVDWDVHHGNGTQDIVESNPSIFYFSTHESPLYPGTGKAEEHGCGNVLNFPIRADANSRANLLNAYRLDLVNAMKTFQPELVLISAGFDAHEEDLLGHLNLKTEDFGELTKIVKSIADEYAQGRIVSVLEGGYNLEALGDAAESHVRAFLAK
jgi:acetoin utilization deacetylase AcuC-like enzyme